MRMGPRCRGHDCPRDQGAKRQSLDYYYCNSLDSPTSDSGLQLKISYDWVLIPVTRPAQMTDKMREPCT